MTDPIDRTVVSRLVRLGAAQEPDRVVFVFENQPHPDEVVTFADLERRGNQLASRLLADGIQPGDRVAVMLRNHPEFVYAFVAHTRIGVTSVPVDPRSRGEKLRYFLELAETRALVAADYTLAEQSVSETVERTGVGVYAISTPEGRAAGVSLDPRWPTLNEIFEGPETADVGEHVSDLRQPWLLAYTSGTTGDPKAIVIPHLRLAGYDGFANMLGYLPEDVPYTGLSLIHGNAIHVTFLPALHRRVDHSVFSRWFTRSRLWSVCRDYGATSWSNLGGIATGVYSLPPSPADRDHSVRTVISAGMPRDLWLPFEERYGIRILEWYGAMEGGFAYHPIGFGPVGSFGKPPGGTAEMDVVDEQGRPVPAGVPGELVWRPRAAPAHVEYYRNPDASARKVHDGWLWTGDIVTRDENGWFFFEHRKEEGGLRKLGEFISESFVRRVVAEYSDIVDVHIYGIASRGGAPGETDIVAAVVVGNRQAFDLDSFLTHCLRELEPSHVPDLIQFVPELPLTASAKVQTRFLIEALANDGADVVWTRSPAGTS